MNDAFWQNYYREPHTLEPTAFALWSKQFLNASDTLLDFGCGNGRDTYYLSLRCRAAIGIDAYVKPEDRGRATFTRNSIALFPTQFVDVVYSRFLLHALDREGQSDFYVLSAGCLQSGGLFLGECRSSRGEMPLDGKDRTPLSKQELIQALESRGLRVCQLIEDRHLAITMMEDPLIIRVAARKEAC